MKAPTKHFLSNRIDMPRQKLENTVIYKTLNKGSERFREEGFRLELPPRKVYENHTRRLYVSSMPKCGRLLWFELHAPGVLTKKPFDVLNDPDNWRISHMGDISEAYVIRLLTLGGIRVYNCQKRISDFDNQMSGKIDGILQFNNEKEALLEIKALKHDRVVELNKYGVHIAMPHYYEQMQIYMYHLELEQGYLVVLDCDTRQFYIEKVTQDLITVDRVRRKARGILNAEVVQQVPEYLIERDCFFCPAQQLCKKLDKQHFERLYNEYQAKHDAQHAEVRKRR